MTDDGVLLHVLPPPQWADAQQAGAVTPPSLAEVGFVHLCTPAQLDRVLERHHGGAGELVVLEVDPAALTDEVRWEESHPGEHYPHLYGPLPVAAVVATRRRPAAHS